MYGLSTICPSISTSTISASSAKSLNATGCWQAGTYGRSKVMGILHQSSTNHPIILYSLMVYNDFDKDFNVQIPTRSGNLIEKRVILQKKSTWTVPK